MVTDAIGRSPGTGAGNPCCFKAAWGSDGEAELPRSLKMKLATINIRGNIP